MGSQPGRRARPARTRRSRRRRRAWPGLPATRNAGARQGLHARADAGPRGLRVGRQRGRTARTRPSATRGRRRRTCRLPHGIDAVAAGASHSLALTTTGEVMAWGSNNHGQLGRDESRVFDGAIAGRACRSARRRSRPACISRWRSATAATSTRGAGTTSGQLGLADRDDRRRPTRIPELSQRAVDRGRTGACGRAGLRRPLRMGQQRGRPARRRREGTAATDAIACHRHDGRASRCLKSCNERSLAPRFPAARRHDHRRRRGSAGR